MRAKGTGEAAAGAPAGYLLVAFALFLAVIGLGLDILWHQLDLSSHEEGAVALSNPGHVLIGLAGALALAGTVAGLYSTNRIVAIMAAIIIPAAAIGFALWETIEPPHESTASSEAGPHEGH